MLFNICFSINYFKKQKLFGFITDILIVGFSPDSLNIENRNLVKIVKIRKMSTLCNEV